MTDTDKDKRELELAEERATERAAILRQEGSLVGRAKMARQRELACVARIKRLFESNAPHEERMTAMKALLEASDEFTAFIYALSDENLADLLSGEAEAREIQDQKKADPAIRTL